MSLCRLGPAWTLPRLRGKSGACRCAGQRPVHRELGLPGFAEPIHVTCSDHNGHANVFLVQWDGTKWVNQPGSIAPIHSKVQPLIDQAAEEYVKANTGWPKRTEACDKSS
jgi:branched-chain amino acid transport system substrate-binding protein